MERKTDAEKEFMDAATEQAKAQYEQPTVAIQGLFVFTVSENLAEYMHKDKTARHMRDALPNASFIGFSGTPIERTDANTRAVFGDYISIYDIHARAVLDGATVPIYYESRLAKLALDERERPKLDREFDEATEGEDGPSLDDLADEFGHAFNKCVALGNPEGDLPKLPKKSSWTEEVLLQKIAEINLILKESEEE